MTNVFLSVCSAQQIRLHDCDTCVIDTTSSIVIERCRKLTITPLLLRWKAGENVEYEWAVSSGFTRPTVKDFTDAFKKHIPTSVASHITDTSELVRPFFLEKCLDVIQLKPVELMAKSIERDTTLKKDMEQEFFEM